MMFENNEEIEVSTIEQRIIRRSERGVVTLAFGQIFYGIICAFLGYLFFLSIVFVAIAAIGIFAVRRRNAKLLIVFTVFSVFELIFLSIFWISLFSAHTVWWIHLIVVMLLVFHILGLRNAVTLIHFARKYGPRIPESRQEIDVELQDTPMQTVTVETVPTQQQQQPIAMLQPMQMQQQPMFYPTQQQQQIAMLQPMQMQPQPMFYNPQQQMQPQPMFYYPQQQMQQQPQLYTPTYPQQQN